MPLTESPDWHCCIPRNQEARKSSFICGWRSSNAETAGLLDAEVVGEVGDEAGEELQFFVGGSLFVGCFECAEGRAKTCVHLILWDGETPGWLGGAGELIDGEQVRVGMLEWAVLWEFGGIDLADL